MTAPAWMGKHQCTGCGTGYGICAQGAQFSLKCCEDCAHPTRWADNPWTAAEYTEMWEGRVMPAMVKDTLRKIRAREAAEAKPETGNWEQSLAGDPYRMVWRESPRGPWPEVTE